MLSPQQALLRFTTPTSNPLPSSSSTKETNLLSLTRCTTPPTISRSQGKEDPGHGDVSPKPHPWSGGLSCRSKMGEVRSSQTLGSKIRPSPPPSSLGLAVTLEKPTAQSFVHINLVTNRCCEGKEKPRWERKVTPPASMSRRSELGL